VPTIIFQLRQTFIKRKIIEGLARGFSMDLCTNNYFFVTMDIYSVWQKRKIIEGLARGFPMNISTYNFFFRYDGHLFCMTKEKNNRRISSGFFSMNLSTYNCFLVTTDI
jgi:hypothetical protein